MTTDFITGNKYGLKDIVSDIQAISLNKKSIYDVIMDMFDDFNNIETFSSPDKNDKIFDKFWINQKFIDVISQEGQISIVLGIQSIVLDENIPFNSIIDSLLNNETLEKSLKSVTMISSERKLLTDFIYHVRKELFYNVFYSNVKLQSISLIRQDILDSRLEYFTRKST